MPYFGGLFPDEPLPHEGWIDLADDKPGFGVTLDKTSLHRPYSRSEEHVSKQRKLNGDKKSLEKPHMPF